MSKTTRIVHLLLFVVILYGLNYWLTGSTALATGDAAIWFHAGLFMLVVGSYWIEPFFTKPSDVVVNSLVVFVSISTLNAPPFAEWWSVLRYGALALMCLAFISIQFGIPERRRHDDPLWVRVAYDIVVRLGSARVLFSTVFVLALVSYFDLGEPRTKWFALAWLAILLARELRLAELLDEIFRKRDAGSPKPIGLISRFLEPNIVRFRISEGAQCKSGAVIAFTSGGAPDRSSPLAYVLHHRRTADALEAEAILLDVGFQDGALDQRTTAMLVDPQDPVCEPRLQASSLYCARERKVGYAKRDSSIARLEFELVRPTKLEEGYLVTVSARGKEVFYQITDATLSEEVSLEASKRQYTIAGAGQLGTWNQEKQGFAAYSWSPPESAPVFEVTAAGQVVENLFAKDTFGHVPNSTFPVQINISDFVLYHSAILGVTGSGKSFLSYAIIERCSELGIKVICLDVTGDYKRYLESAVILPRPRHIEPFLNATEGPNVAIVEFSEQTHPIVATQKIVEIAKTWCQGARKEDEFITPTAKVLLVLEEAHTLVPEWNFNPQRNLQDVVSSTAQAALQARKYGLGFCVVTQRTANVTKSILNQCNTVISFQAFDETSFDFLRNYMGQHYVSTLPNLAPRQGVLVGKASKSAKPLIVRFKDQDRQVRAEPASAWQDAETEASA